MKKKRIQTRNIYVGVIVAVTLLLIVYLLFAGGTFSRGPALEIRADNCYEETLRVAADVDYLPYSFYDSEGRETGHDVEAIALIANELHMNLDLVFAPWSDAIRETVEGRADVLLTCDYYDDFAGSDTLLKTEPVSTDDFVVYAKTDIRTVNELYRKKIAVMENANVMPYIRMLHLENSCKVYKSNREAMAALENGEVDCTITRYMVGEALLKELGCKDISSRLSIGLSYVCFDVGGNDQALLEKLNGAIETLKENGALDRLHNKWLTAFVHKQSLKEIISGNVGILVGFVLFLAAVSYLMVRAKDKKDLADAENAAKTSFLFNMSHDIRTPMNAIVGFTEKALRHADDPAIVTESLEKARYSGDYLLKLINNVLDMAKIESGKLELNNTLHHADAGSASMLEVFSAEAAAKGVELNVSFETKDKYLWLDEERTVQIISNLLSNAVKYTPRGGRIDYSVLQIPCRKAGYARIVSTVKDTGCGMNPDFLERIFDSFERERSATESGVQGTGLGMAIVKKLVDAMGGTIDIWSEPGKGTTVSITLEHKVASPEDIEIYRDLHDKASALPDDFFKDKRILVVEDNALNREIAVDLLEEKGILVETAENGSIAVGMIRKAVDRKEFGYYAAVLMDVQMPVMNGYEAAKAIRAIPAPEGVHLPIIAMTANAFEEDRQNALAAGMDDHISKPIDINRLFRTLALYL